MQPWQRSRIRAAPAFRAVSFAEDEWARAPVPCIGHESFQDSTSITAKLRIVPQHPYNLQRPIKE